jgi:hypothetical protein
VTIDRHGQPLNRVFNNQRNVENAVSGLLAVLRGISADNELAASEVLFLDAWLRSQESLKDDGDLIDLVDLIGDVLADGQITRSELDDIQQLVQDILAFREPPILSIESQVNRLLGMLSGIASDGKLTLQEIGELTLWLNDNPELTEQWPGDVLSSRLSAILADGQFDPEEQEDLLETCKQIAGPRFVETGLSHGMSTEFLEDPVESIDYDGCCFCFTGKFVTGGRKTVEQSASRRGADHVVVQNLLYRDGR